MGASLAPVGRATQDADRYQGFPPPCPIAPAVLSVGVLLLAAPVDLGLADR